MLTIIATATCKCCTIEMDFRSVHRARAAFDRAGLSECAVITDDIGNIHGFVNTFEDFSAEGTMKKALYMQVAA